MFSKSKNDEVPLEYSSNSTRDPGGVTALDLGLSADPFCFTESGEDNVGFACSGEKGL